MKTEQNGRNIYFAKRIIIQGIIIYINSKRIAVSLDSDAGFRENLICDVSAVRNER